MTTEELKEYRDHILKVDKAVKEGNTELAYLLIKLKVMKDSQLNQSEIDKVVEETKEALKCHSIR